MSHMLDRQQIVEVRITRSAAFTPLSFLSAHLGHNPHSRRMSHPPLLFADSDLFHRINSPSASTRCTTGSSR